MESEELGGYRLIEELGSGGMGVVYLGIDGGNSPVAVKVLHPHISSDETARKRLARETRTLRRIKHPRIAEVLDAELESDRPFIITEFVDGTTLSDDVREHGPFQEDELVHFGHALLDALNAVHEAGVIHRDLKPANVMIMDGEPMVIDFGIAQVADEVKVTATGLVMGTPGYLSPEIADGKPSSEKTDWWGWAATMVFAATGRNPFGSGPLEAVLGRVAMGKADLEDVPPRFVPLLRACLEPKPERRPSGAMILQALVDIESGRVPELAGGARTQIPRAGDVADPSGYPGQPRAHHGPAQTAVGLPAVAQNGGQTSGGQPPGGRPHGGQPPSQHAQPSQPDGRQPRPLQPGERPYGALTLDEAERQRRGASSPNAYAGAAYAGGAYPQGQPGYPHQSGHVGQPGQPGQPGYPGPNGGMQPYGNSGHIADPGNYSPYAAQGKRLPGAAWLLLALNLFAIVFSALGPFVVAALMLIWQVIARTAGRLHSARRRRLVEYGPQAATAWSAAARAPGSALASVFTTLLCIILPAVAAVAAAVLAWLDVVNVIPTGRNEEWSLWCAALVFAVVLWLGPGSQNLRLGSRVLVSPMARSARSEAIWAIILVVLAALAVTTVLGGASAVWWPSPVNPFEILPEPGS